MSEIFKPCDILLPKVADMTSWSVIACDQFTSQPEYWQSVRETVGNKPSTLNMILPEAEMSEKDTELQRENIYAAMQRCLDGDFFRELKNSYVYIERRLSNDRIRKGIIGAIDLEAYDRRDEAKAPIRATEGTVLDRLPPRIKIRQKASLEMPHIIVFVDDPYNTVISSVKKGEKLYDFELMLSGGHITGWQVTDNAAVSSAFSALFDGKSMLMAIGDGNHSVAAAKEYWDCVKTKLSVSEQKNHPARYALVELENIHDPSIEFKPIHRVISKTDPKPFFTELKNLFPSKSGTAVRAISEAAAAEVYFDGTAGEIIAQCEDFCKAYAEKYGGELDYIHGDTECTEMAMKKGFVGLLMPQIEKQELFASVEKSGAFPRKSFSIGEAVEKRYYLECRKIK